MDDTERPMPTSAVRGRGAATNDSGRYEVWSREATDDGWPGDMDALPPLRTEIAVDASRTILTRNTSPDLPFDRSVNPYRGCEHGCVYCFARPSHAQLGLSPGLDFETRLTVKPRAPALLARTLARAGYEVRPIAIGTNTDPYQPIERRHRIMRGVLGVLEAYGHPVCITTKGAAVTDDVSALARMGEQGIASVTVSLTTLDPRLSRSIEPRAASPQRRLDAIRTLSAAGVPVQVNLAPIIPGLNDAEIEALAEAAADAGARAAAHTVLRLPLEVAALFRDWLKREKPDAMAKIMRQVREIHGGRDYDPKWGKRLAGEGVLAELISRRVSLARKRHGLAERLAPLDCSQFRRPTSDDRQLGFDF